jgi:glycerol-3-phosphate dehydrogenase
MNKFSYIERENILNQLENDVYDLIVIGGGITGCGIALDAVSRGIPTLLIEMQDFASGTSSRSTKLVHGGLRYLKQFDISTVSEVGKEREIVYNNAKHVTHPEWMLLPIYKGGTFGKYSTSIGLRVYDTLAGVKKHERRKMLSANETLKREPLLKQQGLIGGGYYVEYRTDDARLTLEIAKKAHELGADLLTYCKVESFLTENKKVSGVIVQDVLTGERKQVKGLKVVNAAGPWVEQLIALDEPVKGKKLLHTKGIHLVFDQQRFPLKQAVYFDTMDGRMIFAVPRDGKTYVGTTDTIYQEDLQHPSITTEDVEYVLNATHFMFPDLKLTPKDVESAWSGIRPLIHQEGKGPSEISRKDEIWKSSTGLYTIAGGKLTGYRKMAQNIVDQIQQDLKSIRTYKECQTKKMRLSGGDFDDMTELVRKAKEIPSFRELGMDDQEIEKMVLHYGSNIKTLAAIANNMEPSQELPPSIQLIVDYGIEYEMVMRPVDFFIRRTGALLFRRPWLTEWKEPVIRYMAEKLNWSQDQLEQYTKELENEIDRIPG